MNKILEEIKKLSIEEQLQIASAIWENIEVKDFVFEPTAEEKAIMEQRISAHKKNPKEGYTWEEVKARALARL